MPTEIRLPFIDQFRELILSGQKTMTCRSERMGKPGDVFQAFGQMFVLTHVFRTHVGYVATDAYREEGCDSPREFEQIWTTIHPRRGFEAERVVWAHCFRMEDS